MHDSFFSKGDATDTQYIAARDNPRAKLYRDYAEDLWRDFRPYADTLFRDDARHRFHQRFWEMYLGATLLRKGYKLTKHGDDGPDFSFSLNGKRVWVEAIAPTPGAGPDRVPDIVFGVAQDVPVEKILLRFTNALSEKRSRYISALNKGLISATDAYVLAVNSRGIPHAPLGNMLPFYLQAFLPIGHLALSIDTLTRKVADQFHQYRPSVAKTNQAPVSTRPFLDPSSSFCSLALHSAVDCANYPQQVGRDFSVLHNPSAAVPICTDVFAWCEQYQFDTDQLHKLEPA